MRLPDPDRDRMFCLVWPLVSGAASALVVLFLFAGCATATPVSPSGPATVADVPAEIALWQEPTPERVDFLCRLMGNRPDPTTGLPFQTRSPVLPAQLVLVRGCYLPGLKIIVIEQGDWDALGHELAHARGWHHAGE